MILAIKYKISVYMIQPNSKAEENTETGTLLAYFLQSQLKADMVATLPKNLKTLCSLHITPPPFTPPQSHALAGK